MWSNKSPPSDAHIPLGHQFEFRLLPLFSSLGKQWKVALVIWFPYADGRPGRSSLLWDGPALFVVAVCGVNPWMEDLPSPLTVTKFVFLFWKHSLTLPTPCKMCLLSVLLWYFVLLILLIKPPKGNSCVLFYVCNARCITPY